MSETVSIDKMSDAISEILNEYSEDVVTELKKEVKNAGKQAVRELKNSSPHMTGSYRKGWTSKVVEEKSHKIQVTVHNKTDYQIAHLLEYGHALVLKGGRTPTSKAFVNAKPHIAKAESSAEKYLEKKMEIIVRK